MAGVAGASDAAAQDAACDVLGDGGNAVDAVIAGFFAAGLASEGALFSPLVVLVAGVGAGVHLFDGRSCQPGLDAPRPRGLVAGDEIPSAARAAVPRSLGALALLHAYGATKPWRSLILRGEKAGGEERRAFADVCASLGGGALSHADVRRALIRAAGPAAGGLLTDADLERARPTRAELHFIGDAATCGLAEEGPRCAEVIVAASVLGQVAAIAYAPDHDGIPVPELGLRLCRDAEPVRRGVSRVTPHTPRPSATPLAILRRPGGWYAALAAQSLSPAPSDGIAAATLREAVDALRTSLSAPLALGAGVHRRRTSLCRASV